jgi:hypothetical protein
LPLKAMGCRRLVLSVGCAVIAGAFAQRVGAGGPLDVDVAAYGGAEDVHFSSCNGSTTMPVRYGGVGADVRFYPEMLGRGPLAERGDEEERYRGLRIAAGAAVEYASGRTAEASGSLQNAAIVQVAGPRLGVHATLGYDARYIGFHAGAVLFTPINYNGIGDLDDDGLPDLLLRLGTLDEMRLELGVGAYSPAVIARPGGYIGLGFAPYRDWDVCVRYANARSGGDVANTKLDLELRMPVSDPLKIGVGMALQGSKPEGRLIAAASF